MTDWNQHDQNEDKHDSLYFVFAVQIGKIRDAELKTIPHWKSIVLKFIRKSSSIPKEWISKNNYLHEVALWYDGISMFVYHGTAVHVLFVQYLESSIHYTNQLHTYHALATFPCDAVKVDIMNVIQLIYIYIYIYIYVVVVIVVSFCYFAEKYNIKHIINLSF